MDFGGRCRMLSCLHRDRFTLFYVFTIWSCWFHSRKCTDKTSGTHRDPTFLGGSWSYSVLLEIGWCGYLEDFLDFAIGQHKKTIISLGKVRTYLYGSYFRVKLIKAKWAVQTLNKEANWHWSHNMPQTWKPSHTAIPSITMSTTMITLGMRIFWWYMISKTDWMFLYSSSALSAQIVTIWILSYPNLETGATGAATGPYPPAS